jgi:hypothetical protein
MSFNFLPTIKKLLPNGRAFRVFFNTQIEQVLDGSQLEAGRVKVFIDSIRDSGIPDSNLPADALDDWETFLGLPMNTSLTDAQRRERITGKYAGQGGQGPDYIQDTLQAAGYPVYVLENIPTDNPSVRAYTSRLGGLSLGESTLGAYTDRIDPRSVTGVLIPGPPVWETERIYAASLGNMTLGETTLGEYVGTITQEVPYVIPGMPSTFIFIWFLTGPNGLDDFVDIPQELEQDFINQVIQIKPAHTWVIAQVNFV